MTPQLTCRAAQRTLRNLLRSVAPVVTKWHSSCSNAEGQRNLPSEWVNLDTHWSAQNGSSVDNSHPRCQCRLLHNDSAGSLRRGNPLVSTGVAGEGFEPP